MPGKVKTATAAQQSGQRFVVLCETPSCWTPHRATHRSGLLQNCRMNRGRQEDGQQAAAAAARTARSLAKPSEAPHRARQQRLEKAADSQACASLLAALLGVLARLIRASVLLGLALPCVADSEPVPAGAQAVSCYRVEGQIEGRFLLGEANTEARVDQIRSFSAWFGAHGWLIENRRPTADDFAFCDTENIYEVLDHRGGRPTAVVTEAGYPTDLPWDKRLVWFSYSGEAGAFHARGGLLPPFGDIRSDVLPNGAFMDARWGSAGGAAPERAVFRFSSDCLKTNVQNLRLLPVGKDLEDRDKEIRQLRKTFPEKAVLAEYRVLAWTNAGQVLLPARWVLRKCAPDQRPYYEIEGWVTGVGLIAPPQFPKPKTGTRVLDVRFRDVRRGIAYLKYDLESSAWLAKDDPILRRKTSVTKRQELFITMPSDVNRWRWFFVSLLVLLLSAPAIAAAVHKKTKQAKGQ